MGYSDIFIFRGIDLTRKPYDYYERSGTNCNLSFVGSCIDYSYNPLLTCPDTLTYCDDGFIEANPHSHQTLNYNAGVGLGPIERYVWNNNINDSTAGLHVTSSGYNFVSVTTLDGCYSSVDTVYVKVNISPPPPVITDSYGANLLQPPLTYSIHVCGPATFTLTGGNVQQTYGWSNSTFYVSNHDSVAVVNTSGTFYFGVKDQNGCSNSNFINILLDAPIPPFVPKQKNDTVTFCLGIGGIHIVCDTISNPLLVYPYNCVPYSRSFIVSQTPGLTLGTLSPCDLSFVVNATTTGNYTYTAGYIIDNLCVHDTIYFTGHIYIIVKPNPAGTFTVSGNYLICPGDSVLLGAPQLISISPNSTYTISPNTSFYVSQASTIYYSFIVLDTISGCHYGDILSVNVSVKPNPFINVNPYNSIICPNDSINLSVNLPGAIIYEWHGPAGLIPINSQSIFQKIAGYYYCIVTDNTGCVFTTNTVEIKQYSTPYLISSPSNILCNNNSLSLHVITLDSTLIYWNLPLSGTGATKAINSAGVYSCFVYMCGITTSLSINIIGSNPVANVSTIGSNTVCPFDSVTLYGNAGMTNYIWQPGNFLGQNYTVNTAGSYTLEVTDIYGCIAKSAPVNVAFTSTVSPPLLGVNDTICAGQTATLSVTANGGNPVHWFSTINSGPIINTGTTFVTPIINNQTTFYAASSSSGGCHSNGLGVIVYIYPSSLAPVITGNATVCNHDTLRLTAPLITGVNYSWGGPNLATNTTNSVTIPNAGIVNSGIYTLQTSGSGCTSPTSTISVNVVSVLPPSIVGNDTICENSFYGAAIVPTNPAYIYNWNGPNNYASQNDTLILINTSLNQSGTYTVTANLLGCTNSSTLQLTVLQIPATPSITTNSIVCAGTSILLNGGSQGNFTFNWYGPNNFNSHLSNPTITPANLVNSGIYYLILSNGMCNSLPSFDSVTVLAYPTLSISNDTTACDNSALIIFGISNFPNYLWSTGSNASSISVSQSGFYKLTVANGICKTTDSVDVILIPCTITGANVFTPNGDGSNDVFTFKSMALKDIHCEIWNRWGQKMNEFNGASNGWNGTDMYTNKECVDGTYFYIASITNIEGIKQTLKGYITLIR